MNSTVVVISIIGIISGIVIILLSLVVRRVWKRRYVPTEHKYRKHSIPTITSEQRTKMGKIFRSKSLMRNEIPEFVIPGTKLKLVQPIITPPSPTPVDQVDSSKSPVIPHKGDQSGGTVPKGHTISQPINRKISLQNLIDSPDMSGKLQRRSTTGGIGTPKRTASSETKRSRNSPKGTLSRNPSSNSIDLLAINVPPVTQSASSSLEGSRDSSRQSTESSPRRLRLFRQAKHQIILTGATLDFSFQYNIGQRALNLNIMRVRNIQVPKERKQDAKVYLSVQLKPDKFIWEAQTKIVQGTDNPTFGEMFTISGFSLSKLHDCALLFRLNDVNADQIIGEVTFTLRELQPDVLTQRTCQLQKPLKVVKDRDRYYVGDLLVSMDYDPIDWKLNVRIIRARGLPKMTRTGHTDAFVKINVMQDLTRLFKKKTKVQHHEWNPEFDEGFDFELTRDQMDATSITMKVVHRGKLRDHLIGVVLLGFNLEPSEAGYQHWAMMLDKPHLSIEQWHKIYPILKSS